MTYIKTEVEGIVRDGSTRAILNTDNVAFAAYKQRRQALSEQAKLKEDVAELKSDIHDIKSLLERLLREQSK